MMKKEKIAKGFNAWMDDYINHPEQFMRSWESIKRHLNERHTTSKEPTYGDRCGALLLHYIDVS